MSTLLALSFDSPSSPALTLRANAEEGVARRPYAGWGVAWYPEGDHSAALIKDPTTVRDNAMTQLLRDWPRFRSTVFVFHLRGATRRVSQDDTHPFCLAYAGREWVLTHNGDLRPGFEQHLPLTPGQEEPMGHTDTEHVLCWLIQQARKSGARRLIDLDLWTVHGWFDRVNALGTGNFVLTDGDVLIAYQDRDGFHPLHWQRRSPPHGQQQILYNAELELDLGHALDVNRTALIVATHPLTDSGWWCMEGGAMIVARRGQLIWEHGLRQPQASRPPQAAPAAAVAPQVQPAPLVLLHREQEMLEDAGQLLLVRHRTTYAYDTPVELSHHALRLRPVHDSSQRLLRHHLRVSPEGAWEAFEDVFGNYAMHMEVDSPFDRMTVDAISLVRVLPEVLGPLRSRSKRATIPVDWMPWQRQMMMPYLLPPELPEAQLRELFAYAMSFVERQDYDLAQTFLDMNRTIHADYAYMPGVTTLATTPFQVYSGRRGVCQDFANLLICLARLLGVPARYRVGYIRTLAGSPNQAQSEASHAWVELFLPWSGWRGFDPTNACRVGLDHVRVACGRNYVDATPTSGTIYRGGAGERLAVQVSVSALQTLDEGLAAFEAAGLDARG